MGIEVVVIGLLVFAGCVFYLVNFSKQGSVAIIASAAMIAIVLGSVGFGEKIGKGNPLPFVELEQDKLYQVVGSIPEYKLLLVKSDEGRGYICVKDPLKEFQRGISFMIKDSNILIKP